MLELFVAAIAGLFGGALCQWYQKNHPVNVVFEAGDKENDAETSCTLSVEGYTRRDCKNLLLEIQKAGLLPPFRKED